jgi:8-oxo-dGTP pyrophosphatase MutT (NUDIX family)
MSNWKTIRKRPVYHNPWIEVHEDVVRRPGGSQGTYGVVEVGDAVSVVALAGDSVCLVQQYRHSWGKRVWEVPCGGLDRNESPLRGAKRELLEEAGLVAKNWKKLGIIEANDPVVNSFHLFLARGLVQRSHNRDQSEADMKSKMWPLAEFKRAVLSGLIRDDMTIACVFKALLAAGQGF